MDAKIMELRLREWLPIFEAQAKSGLGKNEWCEKNGVRRWEFYQRQRECRKYLLNRNDDSTASPEAAALVPSFVEIPVDPAPVSIPASEDKDTNDSGHIDVTCGKFKITITGAVNGDVLARLIREVSHAGR
ncbi:MAG: hypothetical protein IK139_08195 [Lachnospiraceae bacterium]|nr:hypothetical protein [Lachnospiraceae bacterium]